MHYRTLWLSVGSEEASAAQFLTASTIAFDFRKKKCRQPNLPDKADVGAKAAVEGSTVGAQKDAKGDTGPAVVVNACMAVEAVLDKMSFQQNTLALIHHWPSFLNAPAACMQIEQPFWKPHSSQNA